MSRNKVFKELISVTFHEKGINIPLNNNPQRGNLAFTPREKYREMLQVETLAINSS